MTKQIENYPELHNWFDDVAMIGVLCSSSLHYVWDGFVAMKLIEMQSKIDELTEQLKHRESLLDDCVMNYEGLQKEVARLTEQNKELQEKQQYAYVVTYMDNVMGVFFTKEDADDFINKFGGVYSVERYEIKSAIEQFHLSFN